MAKRRIDDVMRALAERDVTPSPQEREEQRELQLKAMRAEYSRKMASGELQPLAIDPATGKKPRGTGRRPRSGWLSRILPNPQAVGFVRADNSVRHRSRRERANELQERMAAFSGIRNACWHLRDSYFIGSEERRQRSVKAVIVAFYQAIRETDDYEAALYALADGIYASPSGVPWEP